MPEAFPRLGYGAANVGNLYRELSDEQAWEVMDAAWQSGIRYFDTAPHYGLGLSEKRLGAFLQTKPRDEFVLSTKVGRLLRPNPDDDGGLDDDNAFAVRTTLRREWDVSEYGIRTSIDESLERLGLDRIDVLYFHDPERHDLDQALATGFPALEKARDEGLAREVGIGSMDTQALHRAVVEADLDVIMIAGRYTLLEQPAAAEVLPACLQRGTEVVAASVFNSGLLASDTPSRDGRYEYGQLPDALWDRLQSIAAVCRQYEVPLPAAAVQFALRHPASRSVVVGSSRATQVRQNVAWAELVIPDAFWAELAAADLIPAED